MKVFGQWWSFEIPDFSDATVSEIRALYELNHISADDLQPIAMRWLENGLGGIEVACLAASQSKSLVEDAGNFEKALGEVKAQPSRSQAHRVWQCIRYYLRQIVSSEVDEFIGLAPIIEIDLDYPDLELFPRPDCDAYFQEQQKKFKFAGSRYAGQGLGIEKLYGLYYCRDDYDEWTPPADKRARESIKKDCERLLEGFFSEFAPYEPGI